MFKEYQNVINPLLRAISEGVIVVSENQIIIEINAAARRMFGYDKDELIEKPLNILISSNYHKKHTIYFKEYVKNNKHGRIDQGYYLFGIKKEGNTFPIEVRLKPFMLFGKKYTMAMVIDNTVHKNIEAKIKKLSTELEEKVEQRTQKLKATIYKLKDLNITLYTENKRRIQVEQEINIALKKEQELNVLKTKFLSLVSHEFKTLLSGILTSAILLTKYKLTAESKKRDKHIKIITSKVHYLNTILNDFLCIEKLDMGKIKYNPTTFKVSKVLNELIYNVNILLKEGQKINYPKDIDDFSLHQDEKILELTLFNLVHNAIKYSSENTFIDIFITQDNLKTVFKVKDNGIGIPKKDQKNIFNRYFRAENVLLRQGTGIGLNIVKNHIENLGGEISFTSKENTTTTFTVSIPNKASS
jgi:PAS domain S-box-containing protein